jgi:hypothetical protein
VVVNPHIFSVFPAHSLGIVWVLYLYVDNFNFQRKKGENPGAGSMAFYFRHYRLL